jgi:hypothetical protein
VFCRYNKATLNFIFRLKYHSFKNDSKQMKDPIRILVFSALFIILTLYTISNPFYSVFNVVQGKKHSRIADKNDIVSSGNSENAGTEAPLPNTHNDIGINNSTLQITTDKQRYLSGETVIVTIKNKLKIPIEFPDSLLGLNIENIKTGQKAGLLAAQVISELKPNESKTFQWDQKDTNANQAEPGVYKAESSSLIKSLHNSQPITAITAFSISRNP